jgi:hypothetical protein
MTTWAVTMVNPSVAPGLFSPCGLYRYRLERETGDKTTPADPTIRKVDGFAERHVVHRYIVVNEFGFVATDIKKLRDVRDPVGPENDRHIEQAYRDADRHIFAFGTLAKLPPRLRGRYVQILGIARRVGVKLECFGVGQDGQPRHPLMLGYDTPIVEWVPR